MKMSKILLKRHIALLLFSLVAVVLQAQVHVEAKIDSVQILIGEQVRMTVEVTAHNGARVTFPTYKRSQLIVPGVEVLDCSSEEKTDVDGQTKVSRSYTLTSFDEHLYAIPGVKVKVDGKPYTSNTLALKVISVDVDTLHADKFFPPKDVQDNPFLWSEWSPVLWMCIFVLVLSVVCLYLVVRLRQNKPIITHIRIVKRVPAHQKALNTIDKLKSEHLATPESQKEYYTRLTDALRQYIEERFGFSAKEMTSSEILYRLQEQGDRKMLDELKELFTTADLVKFAKYSTLLNENDLNLVNAINFIDQTKIEGQPTTERIVPELSADDKRTQSNRTVIKTAITVVVIAIAVLASLAAYRLYLLLE